MIVLFRTMSDEAGFAWKVWTMVAVGVEWFGARLKNRVG